MSLSDDILTCLSHVRVYPQRLTLDLRGVETNLSMLRGVWGAALRELDPAAYVAVFDPASSPDPVHRRRSPAYILRWQTVSADHACFEWILLGEDAATREPVLSRAWRLALNKGLGPRRVPIAIAAQQPVGPDGGGGDRHRGGWPLSDAAKHAPAPNAAWRLWFHTPLRILRKRTQRSDTGALVAQPALPDLVVAAARRIAAVLPDGYRRDWDTVRAPALELARQTPASLWIGAKMDLHRWSARQRTEVHMRGVSGTINLPHGPGPIAPLLSAARWTHLGKATTLGLGQLQINAPNPITSVAAPPG